MENFILRICLVPIGVVVLIQMIYGLWICEDQGVLFALVSVVLLIPAIVWLRAANFGGTLGYCGGLSPWLIWANHAECGSSSTSGGASMAYVAVFLWGVLTGLLFGWMFSVFQKRLFTNDR